MNLEDVILIVAIKEAQALLHRLNIAISPRNLDFDGIKSKSIFDESTAGGILHVEHSLICEGPVAMRTF